MFQLNPEFSAPAMEVCLEYPKTAGCPKMVGVEALPFSQYDYRLDAGGGYNIVKIKGFE